MDGGFEEIGSLDLDSIPYDDELQVREHPLHEQHYRDIEPNRDEL